MGNLLSQFVSTLKLQVMMQIGIHLVEPRALQNEHAPAKELQDDVVLDEHLQHDAG